MQQSTCTAAKRAVSSSLSEALAAATTFPGLGPDLNGGNDLGGNNDLDGNQDLGGNQGLNGSDVGRVPNSAAGGYGHLEN